MDHIRRGMPDSGLELDKSLREYHRFRHDLHEVDGVLCYRDRIVVPTALRTNVLIGIHAAHQLISGMTGISMPELPKYCISTRMRTD